MDIQCMDPVIEGVDLEHYGVLGMKWYQHKFGDKDGRAKYLSKGTDKLSKYASKADKSLEKAQKASIKMTEMANKAASSRLKADTSRTKFFKKFNTVKAKRAERKFTKLSKAYEKNANAWYKYQNKGAKMATRMETVLGDINMSELDRKQIELGERFCMNIVNDSWRR